MSRDIQECIRCRPQRVRVQTRGPKVRWPGGRASAAPRATKTRATRKRFTSLKKARRVSSNLAVRLGGNEKPALYDEPVFCVLYVFVCGRDWKALPTHSDKLMPLQELMKCAFVMGIGALIA